MSISAPYHPESTHNLTFPELLSTLQSMLNVDEADLMALFNNQIYPEPTNKKHWNRIFDWNRGN